MECDFLRINNLAERNFGAECTNITRRGDEEVIFILKKYCVFCKFK